MWRGQHSLSPPSSPPLALQQQEGLGEGSKGSEQQRHKYERPVSIHEDVSLHRRSDTCVIGKGVSLGGGGRSGNEGGGANAMGGGITVSSKGGGDISIRFGGDVSGGFGGDVSGGFGGEVSGGFGGEGSEPGGGWL